MTRRLPHRFVVVLLAMLAATATLAAPAAAQTVLALDDRGPAVIELQTLLTNQGFNPGPIDGKFGPRTEAAVRSFQTARSLPVTGVVDTATWTALGGSTGSGLRTGDRGDRVLELQRLLAAAGHNPGPLDGVFGSKTAAAVSAFQQAASLPVTGIADQATWDRLAGAVVLLRRGSTGNDVLEVQTRLANLGYPPRGLDGKYGLLTEAAVWAFQQGSGSLPVTGVVDSATLAALRAADTGVGAVLLDRGSRGPAVLELQNRLTKVGFSVGPLDGGYGERTAAAVARFQSTFRLPGAGAFNEVTNRRLIAYEREAERGYAAGYVAGAGAEQWRPMIQAVFARWGLDQEVCAIPGNPATCVPSQVEAALSVMHCESRGIPFVVNVTSGVTGLFQHRMTYWTDRVQRVRARFADFPADASPFNPEHNAMAAALLVWQSRDTLLKRLAAGGTIAAGPHPWSAWNCR
ncbi:MAG: peptidoglycan-binding protein [Acidimicrobiia bacterium]|nr:peptidoglycan-binding protein [Acidimicrobiia bacterium]